MLAGKAKNTIIIVVVITGCTAVYYRTDLILLSRQMMVAETIDMRELNVM